MNEIRPGLLPNLPDEMLGLIIEKLEHRDKLAMVRVNKRFRVITFDVAKKEVACWIRFKDFIERNLGEKLFIKDLEKVIVLTNLPAINLINQAFQLIIFSRLFKSRDLNELTRLDLLAITEELPRRFRTMIKYCLDYREAQDSLIITPDSVTITHKAGTFTLTEDNIPYREEKQTVVIAPESITIENRVGTFTLTEDNISIELKPEFRRTNEGETRTITFNGKNNFLEK